MCCFHRVIAKSSRGGSFFFRNTARGLIQTYIFGIPWLVAAPGQSMIETHAAWSEMIGARR